MVFFIINNTSSFWVLEEICLIFVSERVLLALMWYKCNIFNPLLDLYIFIIYSIYPIVQIVRFLREIYI